MKDTSKNLAKITSFIQSQTPDIVGLIEVDIGSIRAGRTNQAESIAEAIGHVPAYESKYAKSSLNSLLPIISKQGNAFLTSGEVAGQRFHYFDTGIKRLIIELELEHLSIFLVHLSLKYRHRHYQLRHLYSLVENSTKPVIVAGDFNTLWGDYEIDLFNKATGLLSANVEGSPSYPSWSPRKQLDFILHSPEIKVTHFAIPDGIRLSDHLPLICDFTVEQRVTTQNRASQNDDAVATDV